jgi:hypothetical protein
MADAGAEAKIRTREGKKLSAVSVITGQVDGTTSSF